MGDWVPAPTVRRTSRRATRDDETTDKDLHRLVVLIQRRRFDLDQPLIGTRLRRSDFEDFVFNVQLTPRPHGSRPTKFFKASAEDSTRRLELTFHEQAHGERSGMPAACRQSAEQ